ncbi:hypothetical protein ACV35N_35185, partial [Pseudomonas aeruginosa]
ARKPTTSQFLTGFPRPTARAPRISGIDNRKPKLQTQLLIDYPREASTFAASSSEQGFLYFNAPIRG